MDLFHQTFDKTTNILPNDGVVNYYGRIFSDKASKHYFDCLLKHVEWEQDKVVLFGKKITTKRKVAWYGNKPYQYSYSNSDKVALPWIPELLNIKQLIEQESGETFNSCLLNLYGSRVIVGD